MKDRAGDFEKQNRASVSPSVLPRRPDQRFYGDSSLARPAKALTVSTAYALHTAQLVATATADCVEHSS
ncbi:unnamed protein product [Gadus morhua 'NCC']